MTKLKKNDSSADHEDGDGVADAPKCSNQGCPCAVALIADDGCDRYDVVGVRGVAYPQEKSTARMERKVIMHSS
jgi:hypothetical protein